MHYDNSMTDMMNEYQDYCLGVGRKVAALRKKKGLSQKWVAQRAGISSSYLAKIECASGTLGTSMQVYFILADILQVKLPELFDLDIQDRHRVRVYKQMKANAALVEFKKFRINK